MKRMMAHRRIGCMLSGGLDSSLITGLVVQCAKELGLKYPIQTFSVGMDDSPDIIAARKVNLHYFKRDKFGSSWELWAN